MALKLSAFLIFVLLVACVCTIAAGQGPVVLQEISNHHVGADNPLNEMINLRANLSHPDPDENLILTVK